jgi:hypothetical protein
MKKFNKKIQSAAQKFASEIDKKAKEAGIKVLRKVKYMKRRFGK